MAAANQLRSLMEEATCSICLDYFTDPVSVECGHTFCLSCITQYWEGLQTDFPCPECRKTSQSKRLRPNKRVASMVEISKQLPVPSATSQGVNLCRKHEEKLKVFCEDDQEPICVVCSVSRDHKQHKMLPIREAAQECKVFAAKVLNHVLPNLTLGSIDPNCISRNKKEVDVYTNDPLVYHGGMTVRFGMHMLNATTRVEKALPQFTLPFLLLHGTEDKLCDIRGSYAMIEKAPSQNKTLKVYEGGFHVLHKELPEVSSAVFNEIETWLAQKITEATTGQVATVEEAAGPNP